MWIYVLLRCESYMQRWATGADGKRTAELVDTFIFGSYISF